MPFVAAEAASLASQQAAQTTTGVQERVTGIHLESREVETAVMTISGLSSSEDAVTVPGPDDKKSPPCTILPTSGKAALVNLSAEFESSCTWQGDLGLKVLLKSRLVFKANLFLKGDVHIIAAAEMDGPCITVHGDLLIKGHASFSGCVNKARPSKGGAIRTNGNVTVSDGSTLLLDNCQSRFGGGAWVGESFHQQSESSVVCASCEAESGGCLRVHENFSQNLNASFLAWNCSASKNGGGVSVGSFQQEAYSATRLLSCRAKKLGGGLRVSSTFTQSSHSVLHVRNCSANIGGGASVEGGFYQNAHGSARFSSCRSRKSGGGLRAGSVYQDLKSSFHAENCAASEDGGGLYVDKKLTQISHASLHADKCSARDGGGVFVGTSYDQEAHSTARFTTCRARRDGGGAFVRGRFRQNNHSKVYFASCRATFGGGLHATEVQQHLNSSFEAENCTATDGGGIHLSRPDSILGSASRASFHQGEQSSARFSCCRAEKRGGGLNVEDDFLQGLDSWLHADQCVATHGGGVFIGGSLSQTEHSLARFTSCSAEESGGGAWSADVHQEDHSSAILKNCSAKEGGGIFVNASFYQLGHSSSRFTSCSAEVFGGGLRVRGDLIQNTSSQLHAEDCFAGAGGSWYVTNFSQEQDSQAEFENCIAVRNGGGMLADATFAQGAGGHTRFERCTALQQAGGGLSARTLFSNGSIHFRSCSADKGRGLHVQDGGKLHCGGSLLFQDCAAKAFGGGILSEAGEEQAIANLSFERCRARAASVLMMTSSSTDLQLKQLFMTDNTANDGVDISAAGSIAIEAAHFHSQSGGVQIETAQSLRLDDVLDCTNVSRCTFRAKTAHVAGFRCPVGTGVGSGISSLDQGCLVCAEGYTQVLFGSSEPCLHCPDKARQCFASHFEMESGTMVEHTNVSRSFHCPNEAACPGGQLPGGTPMCAEGYNGPGCVGCTTGHAKADSSVLSCTRCSDERLVQASQWMLFLSQRMLLFGLTATSAGAKSAGDLKESSIYLNQLMAFATISTMVFTAVMQTNTAKDLKSNAITFLFGAAMVVADTGSGQGSVGFASSQCLLSYIGFQQTLGGSHVLDITVAAVLVVILSLVKDHRVALVAGLNCFLPSIVADFGKYMVCYRLEPDDGSGLERLRCPFLPEGSKGAGFVQVCAGLVLFLTVALLAWVRLSMSKELPPPSHVVFLTGKYKETYALFEMERLVRKTLWTFIGAMLPIASAPALQMGCLGAVVFSSLLLYGAAQPYHTPAWTRSEIALLATATYMIMVSGLLANEFHWGHSVATQQFIVVSTMNLGGVVSSYMSFRVFQELIVEQTRAVTRESKG